MRSAIWKRLAILVLGAGCLAEVFAMEREADPRKARLEGVTHAVVGPAFWTVGPERAALRAVRGDGAAVAAIAALRAAGPGGAGELLGLAANEPTLQESPAFHAALDAVCAQRDCAASRLYWYTDLGAARQEARRLGRPILSLRLLGRLDEELSCANSRFFRTVLYANESVARRLREHFVLHWQSERPVPKVTVDFGDGRRLEGTVTGNSVHYVLDSQGRLVDALPGLYGPGAFLQVLGRAEAKARRLAGLPDDRFVPALRDYHRDRLAALKKELTAALKRLDVEDPGQMADFAMTSVQDGMGRPRARQLPRDVSGAPAVEASQLAMTKSLVEGPVLAGMFFGGPAGQESLDLMAALHREDALLDEASRRLLRRKLGSWVGPENVDESLQRFEALLSRDSVHNEYRMHVAVHGALAESPGVPDLELVNDWVYADLFLTPATDPWLGLAPREVFAVLLPAFDAAAADAAAEQVAAAAGR